MNIERELAKNMKAELERNGVVASLKDYESRRDHLIAINDGFHNVLDYIPDFIMIDLLKEYAFSFSYKNIDEFAHINSTRFNKIPPSNARLYKQSQ